MDTRVRERWKAIMNGKGEHERIGIPVGIQKQLDNYGGEGEGGKKKSIPYHIRAAIYSNTWLRKNLGVGDKPMIFYVKSVPRNFDKTHVIALERGDDWPKDFKLDYEKHAQVCLQNPLNNLLRGIDRTFDEVVSEYEDLGALDFF
jgi:hypothetical protein